ncbi:flagellar hook-basal body protein [Sporolactobacillus sp. THM7-7]|nr:flagellar hook-basal body protein [Sporolactobacillus sp. THM7-7]
MKTQMMATAVTLGQIQQQLAVSADNLANSDTVGYKNREATFRDLLVQQVNNIGANEDAADQTGRLTPNGIRTGSGSRIGDTQLDLSSGPLRETGNPFDLALTDDHHFFQIGVAGAGGQMTTAYTRDGAFQTLPDPQNPNRLRLLTKKGQPVLNEAGQPIFIPAGASSVQINRDGAIVAVMPNGQNIAAGRLGLVSINRPQLLENQGDNLYTLPNLARLGLGVNQVLQPVPGNGGSIAQGKLEGSNVNLTEDILHLINLEHAYQLNARSITMSDQMAGLVNGLLRG